MPPVSFFAVLQANAGDAAVLDDEVDDLGLHAQQEGRIMPRLLREEVEEVPLRHQSDEAALHRQMAHIGDGDLPVRDARGNRSDLVVRALQKLIVKAEFAKQLQS